MFLNKCSRVAIAAIAVAFFACVSHAAVVFNDDFAARPNNQDIFGTHPTTAGPTVGTYAAVLTFPYGAKIDPFTPLGKVLKFDTSVGDDTQMIYLPYVYTYGSDVVSLKLTAAHNQANGFNNFAIGFAKFSLGDGHNIFSEHVLIQENQIQFNFPGTDSVSAVPYNFAASTFYTFQLNYDPNLAGVVGQQPWSFSVNGTAVPIPTVATTNYTVLSQFEYVGFGGRFSGGLTTRYISGFSLETNPIPEPASASCVAIALIGLLARRCAS